MKRQTSTTSNKDNDRLTASQLRSGVLKIGTMKNTPHIIIMMITAGVGLGRASLIPPPEPP